MEGSVCLFYLAGHRVECLYGPRGILEAPRRRQRVPIVERYGKSANRLETGSGGEQEPIEQERAVASSFRFTIPFLEDVGRSLRAIGADLARGGDEIVYELICRLDVRGELASLHVGKGHFRVGAQNPDAALGARSDPHRRRKTRRELRGL